MDIEAVMTGVGWVGATATSVALMPQVLLSCFSMRCRMSQVSVNTLLLNGISAVCTLMYATYFGVVPIMFANAMCLTCTLCLAVAKTVDYARMCCNAGGLHDGKKENELSNRRSDECVA